MSNIAVLDLETDPFEIGKVPKPFVAGFYDGTEFASIWAPDCIDRIVTALMKRRDKLTIYAHNGGKFDWLYFLPYIAGNLRIVNGRIVQGYLGIHEIRDSYAILPFALKEYDKDEIDYNLMRPDRREQHRDAILSYLRKDCTSLYELVTAFQGEFGDHLTIGGAALNELKTRHPFETGGPRHDETFRERFYFGGRVQCFQSGILEGPWRVYDVNSMYPDVMARYLHPIDRNHNVGKRISRKTSFLTVEGVNHGAFPTRTKTGLDFTIENGTFNTTIHEFNAAEETGAFRCKRVIKTFDFDTRVTFHEFVNHFYSERKLSKWRGDKIHDLFYKFVLNSAYGKFAQNPANFADWIATRRDELPDGDICYGKCKGRECMKFHVGWMNEDWILWKRPSMMLRYYNIVTGASITGAARAVLLRGLADADEPIYCDTDSIIARSLRSATVDNSELGAWKLEVVADRAAICGKKLYALVGDSIFPCSCETYAKTKATEDKCKIHLKKAHKGALLNYDQIFRIAKGETIEVTSPVPNFKLDGSAKFISRKIRKTANETHTAFALT